MSFNEEPESLAKAFQYHYEDLVKDKERYNKKKAEQSFIKNRKKRKRKKKR